MTDPAILGTLLIGLDHVRREDEWPDGRTATRTERPTRDRGLARRVAASLRWLADVLDPTRRPGPVGVGACHGTLSPYGVTGGPAGDPPIPRATRIIRGPRL